MTAPHGFVDWPAPDKARFRAHGWWTDELIGDALWRSSAAHGDHVALIDGERELTYAQLTAAVDSLAAGLAGLGLADGEEPGVVLVQLPNGIDLVLTTLACLRAGILPVMALPALRRREIAYLAQHARARAYVIADQVRGFDYQALASEIRREAPCLQHVLVAGDPIGANLDLRALGAENRGRSPSTTSLDPEDPAFLLLSGGTTGRPKLIPRTHNDYLYNVRCSIEVAGVRSDTVYLAALPVGHNFALGCPGVLGTLLVGGRVVLLQSPEPTRTIQAIRRHGVTYTATVPAVLARWLDAAAAQLNPTPSLRVVAVGGSRVPPEMARRVRPLLGATVQQAFGMAEGCCNFTRLDDPEDVICDTQGRPMSPGDETRIVDGADCDVVDGEAGELLVRGPYTIRGYFRAPEHNAVAFTGDGWYRTGDLVCRREGGNLIVAGRLKEQINRSGEKIAIEEVEDMVRAVYGVRAATVLGVPDADVGERVAAAVMLVEGAYLPLDELRDALTDLGLAPFKLPERLLIVDEFPLTPVGKVNRALLRERFENETAVPGTGTA